MERDGGRELLGGLEVLLVVLQHELNDPEDVVVQEEDRGLKDEVGGDLRV